MTLVGNEREILVCSVFLHFWFILPTAAHAEIKMLLVKTQRRERRCMEWMLSAAIL